MSGTIRDIGTTYDKSLDYDFLSIRGLGDNIIQALYQLHGVVFMILGTSYMIHVDVSPHNNLIGNSVSSLPKLQHLLRRAPN